MRVSRVEFLCMVLFPFAAELEGSATSLVEAEAARATASSTTLSTHPIVGVFIIIYFAHVCFLVVYLVLWRV